MKNSVNKEFIEMQFENEMEHWKYNYYNYL